MGVFVSAVVIPLPFANSASVVLYLCEHHEGETVGELLLNPFSMGCSICTVYVI